MKRRVLLSAIALIFAVCTTYAQTDKFWSPATQSRTSIITGKAVQRLSYPKEFKLFNLNFQSFQQQLLSITNQKAKLTISLPNAEGKLEDFELTEASNFEPVLQAQFPNIRAFSGKGITDKLATLKLSLSPQGIQTMILRTGKDDEFMEPYSKDHATYSVYSVQRDKGKLPWNCSTPDEKLQLSLGDKVAFTANATGTTGRSGNNLKTYRLAQSVTAEYSNYFGATSASQVSLVLAAVNNTLTRCNGVYEKDLAIHLNLVAASTNVFYYNASTDPYDDASTGAGGTWNAQLQKTLTSVIGEANYDIGHLFGASGGGGNAGCIGCVCVNNSKGSGFTSPADGIPQGDNFDIDYVVHEVGHQLGANHTFTYSNEGTGVQDEIGSGITIMGYAGITSYDVAAHSFDFYHEASISQIQTNVASKTCGTTVTVGNSTPVVAAVASYTIPKSTPFALTGSATDADGDPLTYCWEENDNTSSQTGANSVAKATKTSGPNWVSFRPTTSPTRYFPQLSTILTGGTTTGPLTGGDASVTTEALSSVARTLNFRLTVRDNAVYNSTAPVNVGQTSYTDMTVTVSAASGPFAVTAPNTAVSYAGNSTQTITWDVAGTTASPVSCANVKISLSTDGGQTFPTVLLASTPNDGSEAVTIPNTATTTARIKIESVGNIFFDISNANFTITAGSSCGAPGGLTASSITTTGATLGWTAVSGAASYDVDYKLTSSTTWTNAATPTTATSKAITGLTASSAYDYRVRTNCASGTSAYTSAQFTTAAAPATCNAPTALTASAVTASSATVSWTAAPNAVSYAVDYKLTTSSTWISAVTATTATSVSLSGLSASSTYDWRVSTNCSSGTSAYAASQFTTTAAASNCSTAFEPNETQATAAAITSGTANSAAIISSTDVDYFAITTTTTSSLAVNLAGPSGVDYDLYVYNSSGTQVGSSEGSTATESVSLSSLAAGTYYIKVVGYSGANSTTCYMLTATATAVTGCQSSYDVSSNGTTSGAAAIPLNTDITGLISPSADVDNYKFVISSAGTLTVTLKTLPADYDLKLLNSAGTQVGISQKSGTTAESISYTAAAGTYYAQVYGYSGANSSTSCYTLKVATGTSSRGTVDFAKASVSVYPNPVGNALTISMGSYTGKVTATLTDMYGKPVAVASFAGTTTVNTARFAVGVYMVVIRDKNGVIVKQDRVVKE